MKVGQIVRLKSSTGMAAPVGSTAEIVEIHQNGYWIKLKWIDKGDSGQMDGFYDKSHFEVVNVDIERIIDELNKMEINGEMMEYIIRKVGMEDQMLRQLIMRADWNDVGHLIAEKGSLA